MTFSYLWMYSKIMNAIVMLFGLFSEINAYNITEITEETSLTDHPGALRLFQEIWLEKTLHLPCLLLSGVVKLNSIMAVKLSWRLAEELMNVYWQWFDHPWCSSLALGQSVIIKSIGSINYVIWCWHKTSTAHNCISFFFTVSICASRRYSCLAIPIFSIHSSQNTMCFPVHF